MTSSQVAIRTSDDFLLCNECGTQYPATASSGKDECKICDDPRQYVPATGQAFTTLGQLKKKSHRNVFTQDAENPRIWSIKTEPKFAIGQRALLIQTDAGNVLWDLIAFLDQETVDRIEELGGLEAIVISHPHYYTTWSEWSRMFKCPVYVGEPDKAWLERVDSKGSDIRFLTNTYTTDILPGSGITAILAGGHFPGSLLLHWNYPQGPGGGTLFIADTIFTSPSATNPVPGKKGVISFTFFWSIPNRIPLHPDDIFQIWRLVKGLDFGTAFGAFEGQDIRTRENEEGRGTDGVKGRLLESCRIYVGAMGWRERGIFKEGL